MLWIRGMVIFCWLGGVWSGGSSIDPHPYRWVAVVPWLRFFHPPSVLLTHFYIHPFYFTSTLVSIDVFMVEREREKKPPLSFFFFPYILKSVLFLTWSAYFVFTMNENYSDEIDLEFLIKNVGVWGANFKFLPSFKPFLFSSFKKGCK